MNKIKVAIVGVGNCASSLVQGVEYYKKNNIDGLMYEKIGFYKISDIKFVAAFDIDKSKVGKDLSEAIFSKPNCIVKFSEVRNIRIKVKMEECLDGISKYISNIIKISKNKPVNIVNELKKSKADIYSAYFGYKTFLGKLK